MRIKSKNIAKALGLSTATVSLAINGKPGVNEETRKKVLDYIKQKEYEELGISYTFSDKKEGKIVFLTYFKNGVILNRSRDTAFSIEPDIENTVKSHGFEIIMSSFYEGKEDLDRLLGEFKKLAVKGIYIMGAEMSKSDIYPFLNLNIPIVVGDNNFIDQGVDSYLIDNQEGIIRAVDYLINKGHSNIVYLAENISIFNFLERREAFIHEMAERECGNASNRIWYLGKTLEEVYQSMLLYLDSDSRMPTAFVLESSIISLGVVKALMERGVRIPRDISLIGFDALPGESLVGLTLTLIKGTHTRRHLAAIKHLIRHIEEKEVEIIRVSYKTRLIEGNSVFDKTKYIYKNSQGI